MKLRTTRPLSPSSISETQRARFWSRVDKSNDCWTWLALKNHSGYGLFSINDKMYRAHRVSYTISVGEIPTGLLVCHRCDNPGCVNPSHLFVGTDSDNRLDSKSKGRTAKGDRHGLHLHPETVSRGANHWMAKNPEKIPRGERASGAKLTAEKVIEMRKRFIQGFQPFQRIAAEFGVCREVARGAIIGKRWSHVPFSVPHRKGDWRKRKTEAGAWK